MSTPETTDPCPNLREEQVYEFLADLACGRLRVLYEAAGDASMLQSTGKVPGPLTSRIAEVAELLAALDDLPLAHLERGGYRGD